MNRSGQKDSCITGYDSEKKNIFLLVAPFLIFSVKSN